jgi:hypothetical protein
MAAIFSLAIGSGTVVIPRPRSKISVSIGEHWSHSQ